jgi:hypothetical protein
MKTRRRISFDAYWAVETMYQTEQKSLSMMVHVLARKAEKLNEKARLHM